MHTICLSMIVKDEEKVIQRCLDSVAPSIHYAVIVDTGSNDSTQYEVWKWARDRRDEIYCGWFEREWVDYSTNRNQALDLARATLEDDDCGLARATLEDDCGWILVMDADDVMHGAIDPSKLDPKVDGYMIRYRLGDLEFSRPALIRADVGWQYFFKVHELLMRRRDDVLDIPTLDGVWIECNVGGEYQGEEHFLAHARLLEQEPDCPRSVFYLGQSYQCAGKKDEAVKAYARRTHMRGWDEEVVVSWLRIGELTNDPGAFLEAAWRNTTRGEGLLGAARWFKEHGMKEAAIMFASQAVTKKNPQGLFCERGVDAKAFVLLSDLLRSS